MFTVLLALRPLRRGGWGGAEEGLGRERRAGGGGEGGGVRETLMSLLEGRQE